MVQGEDRAVLGGRGEDVAQPGQLGLSELAVVPARDAGVEADDPEAGDVVHPILRLVRLAAEQLTGVRRTLVVVAHAPHDLGAHPLGHGLDHRAQQPVRVGLAEVGEVAGQHQCLRGRIHPGQPVEGGGEPSGRVDRVVLPGLPGEQVGVADVGEDVGRGSELAVLDHSERVRRSAHSSRSCPSGRGGSCIASPARVIALTRTVQ